MGYSSWTHKESDTPEQLSIVLFHTKGPLLLRFFFLSRGPYLKYSCFSNNQHLLSNYLCHPTFNLLDVTASWSF